MLEIYLLDDNYRRTGVVDIYESLIWTERYNELGDFEIVVPDNRVNRQAFVKDRLITIPLSKRVMWVRVIETETDDDNKQVLRVTGPSIERLLADRPLLLSRGGALPEAVTYTDSGTALAVTQKMFNNICVTGTAGTEFRLDNYTSTSTTPQGDLYNAASADVITVEFGITDLYTGIQQLATDYGIGYRLVLQEADAMGREVKLNFMAYMGNDRTIQNGSLKPVIFDRGLDNLLGVKEVVSNDSHKNAALIITKNKTALILGDGAVLDGVDTKLKTIVVDATDITTAIGTTLDTQINVRAQMELAKYRETFTLDGEISQTSQYVYGRDYNLGDLVLVRSASGATNQMRVTEQIISSDSSGITAYPTVSLISTVTPGTWYSYPPSTKWTSIPSSTSWYSL